MLQGVFNTFFYGRKLIRATIICFVRIGPGTDYADPHRIQSGVNNFHYTGSKTTVRVNVYLALGSFFSDCFSFEYAFAVTAAVARQQSITRKNNEKDSIRSFDISLHRMWSKG